MRFPSPREPADAACLGERRGRAGRRRCLGGMPDDVPSLGRRIEESRREFVVEREHETDFDEDVTAAISASGGTSRVTARVRVPTGRQDRRLGALRRHAIPSTSERGGGANRASRTWRTQRTYHGRASRSRASHAVQSGNASFLS